MEPYADIARDALVADPLILLALSLSLFGLGFIAFVVFSFRALTAGMKLYASSRETEIETQQATAKVLTKLSDLGDRQTLLLQQNREELDLTRRRIQDDLSVVRGLSEETKENVLRNREHVTHEIAPLLSGVKDIATEISSMKLSWSRIEERLAELEKAAQTLSKTDQ